MLGFVHMMLVDPLVRTTTIPFVALVLAFAVGTASYLYTTMLARFVRRTSPYVVETVRRLNGTTVEVVLQPRKKKLAFAAGQFLFVKFKGDKVLAEPHPFTVSSSPKEDHLRLTIKACGDFTRHLYQHLKPGMLATVEGCYGMFDYKQGSQQQIWIAGGIGITPFLSWIRDFTGMLDREIDFYYTVRTREEALFLDEIHAATQQHKSFRAHPTYSAQDGSLAVEKILATSNGKIADKHIYMCGPFRMTDAFQREFRRLGVPAASIHYEEFNFR
jgi:predicted ferric reductase